MYEIDLWRQHREDVLREAEKARLARRLRAARPKGITRLRSSLFRRSFGNLAADLRAGDGGCA